MKIETKTIYKCDHCNKLYQVKNACEKHERFCYKNPNYKPKCFGCEFLTKNKAEVLTGYCNYNADEEIVEKELFFCKEKEVFVTPEKAFHKILEFVDGESENIVMPTECNEFKIASIDFMFQLNIDALRESIENENN